MTNRRIETIEQMQNQQVQVQNILIEQLKQNNGAKWEHQRFSEQEITPRPQAPRPTKEMFKYHTYYLQI
jgi:hypothetical protein